MSAPSLCSAFAIADSSSFFTMRAPFFGENAITFNARSTGMRRIKSATRRPFCADRRTPLSVAVVSIMSALAPRRVSRDILVGRVALERACQRESDELLPDHVLGHVHGNVLFAVVHRAREPHGCGHYRRAPRPGLDRLLVVGGARG